MRVFSIIFVLFFLLINPAFASNLAYEECGETTREMIECSWENYQKADKVLNETYKKFTTFAGKENAQAIKTTQREWISFKEKLCKEVYDSTYPGTAAPIEQNECLRAETEKRLNEIERIIEVKKNGGGLYYDDFVRNIAAFSVATGYKKEEMLSKITAYVSKNSSADWNKYVKSNCEFATSFAKDKRDICEARLHLTSMGNVPWQ